MSINTITLSGNIGTQPELKSTRSGTSLLKFRMAGRSGYGDNEQPCWVSVTTFGKRAEGLAKHLNKGDAITVNGELVVRDYKDRDGNDRTGVEILMAGLVFNGGGKSNQTERREDSVDNDPPLDDDCPF
jgi:single-strand DNA-binding protein